MMAGVSHEDAAASFDPLRPKLMRVAPAPPATDPTAPAAPETTTVSPGMGWQMSINPK